MLCVGTIEHLTTGFFGFQKFGFFELVEFLPHGVGGYIELFGQFPEVGTRLGVEEKTHQQLDTGFRGYKAGQ